MYLVKVREDNLLRHTLFENAAKTSNTLCVVLQRKPSLKKKMSNNKRMRRKGQCKEVGEGREVCLLETLV